MIGGHTLFPNPFWGGAFFPLVVFGVMYAWPAIERRVTGDYRRHDLLDRPRDRPTRTAFGAAFLSWVVIIFAVGSTDRIFFRLHISYEAQIHFWRVGVWVAADDRLLRDAQRLPRAASAAAPVRCARGTERSSTRRPDGGFETVAESTDRRASIEQEPPLGTAPGRESRR